MGKPTSVKCPICTKPISRQSDLPRHMRVHSPDKEKLKYRCPIEGCTRGFLQKSNLAIHIATHKGERPHKCPEPECSFSTADPASLCRHRKRRHGYIPRQRKNGASSTTTTTATTTGEIQRQRQRYKPYTPSSARNTSGVSGSSTSPSSLLLADQWQAEAGPANNLCLMTQPAQVDNSPAHNNHVADAPVLHPKEMIASMASKTMHLQFHTPQQPHATDVAIQPVCDTTLTNGVSDDFLSWFDNWHSPSSHSSPMTSSNIEHVATPASLGPYEGVNDLSILPPASQSPYRSPFIVDNTLMLPPAPQLDASYEYYGYDTGAMSLDAQLSFPDLSTTLDTSVYPQAFYPGNIGQDLFCDTYTGTSGTSMMGLYMN